MRRMATAAGLLVAMAITLSGCTLLDRWSPPNDTRGAADRPDALLRALLVAESRIAPGVYDAYACEGRPCPAMGALADAVDEESAAIRAALEARPDDCLAQTARTDLDSYAAVREFATGGGSDAAFDAADRADRLKVRSYAESGSCRFLPGAAGDVEQQIRQAGGPIGTALVEALGCGPIEECGAPLLTDLAADARAASERLRPAVEGLGEGCAADVARTAHGFLERYAAYAEAVRDDPEGSFGQAAALEQADSALQRDTVLCLDELAG
jgi:hypothetical protein